MDETLSLQDKIPPENGVYKKGNRWFVRFDAASDGAEFPPDVARAIGTGLRIERRSQSKTHPQLERMRNAMVCHEAALYAIGLIHRDDVLIGGFVYPMFGIREFRSFNSVDEFASYLRQKIGDSCGFVQVVVGRDLHDLQHSFLVGFDSLGRAVCAEKEDSEKPFQVSSLDRIFDRFARGYWAAGTIEDVREGPIAREFRERLERRKQSEEIFENLDPGVRALLSEIGAIGVLSLVSQDASGSFSIRQMSWGGKPALFSDWGVVSGLTKDEVKNQTMPAIRHDTIKFGRVTYIDRGSDVQDTKARFVKVSPYTLEPIK